MNIIETGFLYNFEFDYDGFDHKNLRFYFSHAIVPRPEEKTLAIKLDVTLAYGEDQIQLAYNAIAVTFNLNSINDVVSFNSNGYVETRNPEIIDNLLQTVVGTLRGTLYKNLKGTPLEPYPLPLISSAYFRPDSM